MTQTPVDHDDRLLLISCINKYNVSISQIRSAADMRSQLYVVTDMKALFAVGGSANGPQSMTADVLKHAVDTLAIPGRRFITKSPAQMWTGKAERFRQCVIFLFNNLIIIATKRWQDGKVCVV